MSDFKAKMHQIVTPLGQLTALPRPLSWILGPTSNGERGREGEGTPALPLHPQPLYSR